MYGNHKKKFMFLSVLFATIILLILFSRSNDDSDIIKVEANSSKSITQPMPLEEDAITGEKGNSSCDAVSVIIPVQEKDRIYSVPQVSDAYTDGHEIIITENEYKEDEYHNLECDSDGEGGYHYQATAYISISKKYPSITGLRNKKIKEKINKEIQKAAGLFAKESEWPTTIKVTYQIMYRCNEFLGIVFYHNHFACGGYHDTGWYESLNLNLKTGEKYTFLDLFKPDDYEKVNALVVEYLINQLDLRESSIFYPKNNNIPLQRCNENTAYSFDKNNLYILYGMYQVDSAASGEPIISIPLLKLSDSINLNGPLAHVLSHCGCTSGN